MYDHLLSAARAYSGAPTALCLSALLAAGCGTMNSARPLDPGDHAVGLTFGGAMINFGGPLPLPHMVVEGRSGLPQLLDRNLDLNYGLNLTALAFGDLGLHTGASWQLSDQRGGVPALSVTERLYLYNNWIDTDKDPAVRGFWALNQLQLTASWAAGGHLLYAGLGEELDFGNPQLWLTPFAGAALDFGDPGGVGLQLEGRWYVINDRPESEIVDWITPGPGALGATLGLSWRRKADPDVASAHGSTTDEEVTP